MGVALIPTSFAGCTDFWDIYLVTQGGRLRRVTIPEDLLAIACWLLVPGGTPHENIDKHTCTEASERSCGYAEGFMALMHIMRDHEVWGHMFRLALNDEPWWTETKQRFSDDQAAKEREWRAAHDDWRDPLPPAFD